VKPSKSPIKLLAILMLTLLVLVPAPRPTTASARPVPLLAAANVPVPLPRECGGVNPPGQPDPACCAYGYVYYDGVPVSSAAVTVQGPGGAQAVTTSGGEASDDAYFTVSLSDAPVGASVGNTITLSVSYGNRSRTLTYQVAEDGQQVDLVLPANTSDTPIYYVSGSDTDRQVWRMNGDGTGRTYVRDGFDPDICSVNGHVLFVGGGDVHVMDINGNYVANLSSGGYADYNPDWSPDCGQIVYVSLVSGQYRLYKMNADGSSKISLPYDAGGADDWYPEWSPDGQWIAFTSTRSGNPHGDVYRMNADGSNLRRLTTNGGWFPVWSPDGGRIAYVDLREGGAGVYVMSADGSDQRRITHESPGRAAWWPYWFSDDRLMYVTGDDILGNNLDVFLINADGTGKVNLTDDGNSYYRSPTVRPTFSPVATIHLISPSPALQGRDVVTFRGSGQEADENGGTVTAYRWRSSIDGVLSTQAEFTRPASELSVGTHTIYFQVQDDEGDWSPEAWRLLAVTDEPFDVAVLIVTNRERLAALYGEAQAARVMQKLDTLAQRTNGMVLQVEQDAVIAAAYDAWLANPTSFTHANGVADAIHDLIVAQLGVSPDAAYVVIAGDDRVVPFRRVRDRTRHPEHHYSEVPSHTTTGAALAADRTLTDDFYGDRVPTRPRSPDWGSRPLYIPDMAVGRLIETPDEIIGQIDQFLDDDEIEVGEAIVTGYDFMVDSAQEMCSALVADGLFPDCGLIGNSWTATQFINQVLNQRHDVASYSGHANHYTIGAPSGSVDVSQVQGSSGDHSGTLFWTPGCHGALNVPPEAEVAMDTVQALVSQSALLAGNTGYGWGYQHGIGLSEQLMLNYTRHLLEGEQTTAGQALVAAKQQYYLEELDFDEYDEKILVEATFYGIPMTRVTSPGLGQSVTAAVSSRHSMVESMDDLTVQSVHYDFPALTAETTTQGTFYSCDGQIERGDGTPVQPRYTDPISATAEEPHGVVLRAALGEELHGFDPVVDEAIWEIGSGGSEPVFDDSAWFPGTLLRLNQVGGQSELAIGLGQFHGLSETQRLYRAMDVDVYFSDADDWEPPLLWSIVSEQQGGAVVVDVEAEDTSGIHGVVAVYVSGGGNWSSADLVLGDEVWTGDFPGDAETEFSVQVVDGAGNVVVYTRGGQYMRPGDSYRLSRAFLPLVVKASGARDGGF
jgi:Tol biopolymer transport system component